MTTRGTEHFTHLDDDQVAYVHDSLSGRESLLSEFACQDGDAVYENGVSPRRWNHLTGSSTM